MLKMRAVVALDVGCLLRYDCPLSGESPSDSQFFQMYKGRLARFVGYSEKLVGILDMKGRRPGRYLEPKAIKVQFEGEEVVRELNSGHFIVVDSSRVTMSSSTLIDESVRFGDLLHPILFYPGDLVHFVKPPEAGLIRIPRRVREVFIKRPFASDGVPRYVVVESVEEVAARMMHAELPNKSQGVLPKSNESRTWAVFGDAIILFERGNTWKLYHDPEVLSFESDDEEAAFWAQSGVSCYTLSEEIAHVLSVSERRPPEPSLASAYRLFMAGAADIIEPLGGVARVGQSSYSAKRLYDCFAQHRERVRALTERRWRNAFELLGSVAA